MRAHTPTPLKTGHITIKRHPRNRPRIRLPKSIIPELPTEVYWIFDDKRRIILSVGRPKTHGEQIYHSTIITRNLTFPNNITHFIRIKRRYPYLITTTENENEYEIIIPEYIKTMKIVKKRKKHLVIRLDSIIKQYLRPYAYINTPKKQLKLINLPFDGDNYIQLRTYEHKYLIIPEELNPQENDIAVLTTIVEPRLTLIPPEKIPLIRCFAIQNTNRKGGGFYLKQPSCISYFTD